MFVVKFELEPSVRERSLRAFLDLVMIRVLARHSMSGYEIGRVLVKDFSVIVGPSTIYSKLYTLEKHGLIHCIQGRAGKIYSLTEQGHKTTYDIAEIAEEICDYTKIILSDKRSQSRKIEKIIAPKVS